MARIEVGMLVEVLQGTNSLADYCTGEISKVAAFKYTKDNVKFWYLDLDDDIGFAEPLLRPIKPDAEPCDEDFAEDLKRWLGKEVTA